MPNRRLIKRTSNAAITLISMMIVPTTAAGPRLPTDRNSTCNTESTLLLPEDRSVIVDTFRIVLAKTMMPTTANAGTKIGRMLAYPVNAHDRYM